MSKKSFDELFQELFSDEVCEAFEYIEISETPKASASKSVKEKRLEEPTSRFSKRQKSSHKIKFHFRGLRYEGQKEIINSTRLIYRNSFLVAILVLFFFVLIHSRFDFVKLFRDIFGS